jgi:DNA polymerase III alpha subunit
MNTISIPQDGGCEAECLASLVWDGARKRWGVGNGGRGTGTHGVPKEIEDRVDFELHVIKTKGCAGYFLAVHDCVEAARRMGVWVGPGRGTAAGSAVSYALGITSVDPIRHGLLFERFLCPDDATAKPHIAIEVDDEDVIGSRALSVQKCCVNLIRERKGLSIDLEKIPHDEPETMEAFARGDTGNIPVFESEDMRRWLVALKPKCLDELAAMNALYRPGLMEYIPSFVRRKTGVEPIVYDHPLMEEMLRETCGVTVYQEQVMLLSRKLASFTRVESDKLLKAMGKKAVEVESALKDRFAAGCLANPDFRVGEWRDETAARARCDEIWDGWRAFAPCAVTKSHAVCDSWLAYQLAYLKAHYPEEFGVYAEMAKSDGKV